MALTPSPSPANVVVGAGVVSLSAWVTNGGAGSFTQVGYTDGAIEIDHPREFKIIEADQLQGPIAQVPIKFGAKVKVNLIESILENWRIALAQAAGQKTGADPNFIFAVDEPIEAYWQVKIACQAQRDAMKAVGPNPGVRTFLLWRAAIENLDKILIARSQHQILPVTFNLMEDPSVAAPTTKGRFYSVTDTTVG